MNFSELKTKVADYLNRSDLTTSIPGFIETAQRDLERTTWKHMEKRATVDTDEAYITLPSKIKEFHWMKIYLNGRYFPLNRESAKVALDLYPYPSSANGRPLIYSAHEATSEILVRPTPDQTYTFDLYWIGYSDVLVNNDDTNWWTLNAWEILVFGALVEAEPFLINDPRMETWKRKYEEAVAKLKKDQKLSAVSGQVLGIKSYMPDQLTGRGTYFDFNSVE